MAQTRPQADPLSLSEGASLPRQSTWRFVRLLARQRLLDAYRGAGLGAWWSVLPQWTQIATLALILGAVMQHRLGPADTAGSAVPYVVYMLPGVLLWQLFQDTVVQVASALPAQRLIIKKNPVDLRILPMYVPLSNAVTFLIGVGLLWLLVSLLWSPIKVHVIGVTLLCAVGLIVLAYVIGLSWGMVAALIPDVGLALPSILQIGFWLTPIVYPANILPQALHGWLQWIHPWYGLIAPAQSAWTGISTGLSPWGMLLLPALLMLLHMLALQRIVRHGRRVLLDAL